MQKVFIFLYVCIFSLSLPAFVLADDADKQAKQEEVVANETIIKMAKANLGEEVIIGKIKSSKTNFDTSTDAIIKLKEAGVSDKVIAVMLGGGEAAPTAVQTTAGSSKLPAVGDIFLLQNGKLIEIEEHRGYQKGSIAKMIWTSGILGGDRWFIIDGAKAGFRIPVSQDSLVFISKIKEVDLFKLAIKDGKMRYVVGGTSASTLYGIVNIREGYKTKYEVKRNPDGTYTITTKGPLPHGEYAFLTGDTKNASVSFFDFAIDGQTQGAEAK